MKSGQEHWAYDELRKRLAQRTETWVPHLQDASEPQIRRITRTPDHELGTIFLMDPVAREELDQVLLHTIYPHILESMEGESLVVPPIEEIQGKIQDGREWEASRVVTFLMTDPRRPALKDERPLWYFRFTLKVRLLTYMLESDCLISIPFPAAGSWLLDAVADSRIQEAAAKLTADRDEFVLGVSCGAGQTFVGDEWKQAVSTRFRGHLAIAKAVDQFEEQPFNWIVRGHMVHTVANTYETLLRINY